MSPEIFLPMVHQYYAEIEQVVHVLHHMLSHLIYQQRLRLIHYRHHYDQYIHYHDQHLMLMYYYQEMVV